MVRYAVLMALVAGSLAVARQTPCYIVVAQDAELRGADQTIYHDKDHASVITLPIVEAPLR